MAQVMAWCPTAPSHYLNQCWLIISEVIHLEEISCVWFDVIAEDIVNPSGAEAAIIQHS